MLKAIIFDFNGIILDDEPLHFRSMRDVVAALGVTLSMEEYWNRYLPFDDERCLQAICRDHDVEITPAQRERALQKKARLYRETLQNRYPLFPGAAEFIRIATQHYPLAIASGAQRADIESTLTSADLLACFRCIIAAEDFTIGKPHPESFLLVLDRLNAQMDGSRPLIRAHECLVIEDAVAGIQGARAAGMVCLAVSNTYGPERLAEANRVVASLEGLKIESLQDLFEDRS